MKHLALLLLLLAACDAAVVPSRVPTATLSEAVTVHRALGPDLPNVLIVITDDQGTADRPWGEPDVVMPALQSLMLKSVRFSSAYATGNVCIPSRGSIMTSRYVQDEPLGWYRVPGSNWRTVPLPAAWPTVATSLKGAGYATGYFGKWHLGDGASMGLPHHRGFDYFWGWAGTPRSHWDPGPSTDERYRLYRANVPATEVQAGYVADLMTDEAVAWIGAQSSPWLAVVAHVAPHRPLQAAPEDLALFADASDRSKYLAMLHGVDRSLDRLLKAAGDGALVIYLSDNGGPALPYASNGLLRGGKGDNWDGGLRVILGVRFPYASATGGYGKNVSVLDIMPTVLARAGLSDETLEGVDLWDLATAFTPQHSADCLFFSDGPAQWNAARCAAWKWHHGSELYRIPNDPSEIATMTQPGIAASITQDFAAWLLEMGAQ